MYSAATGLSRIKDPELSHAVDPVLRLEKRVSLLPSLL